MNVEFRKRLPSVQDVKAMYPVSEELAEKKKANDEEVRKIITGESDKLLLVIGPCSADREDAVLEYITRLRTVQDKVRDKIVIVP
ncbi:MAG: 3-deoxy-7-phosphoheptulonate synthase, partial [Lachnospiraceae bacterium]|nr:3-deoxy-7-phosphoheptulonate synthase [Lachnospiraceae bacterium]